MATGLYRICCYRKGHKKCGEPLNCVGTTSDKILFMCPKGHHAEFDRGWFESRLGFVQKDIETLIELPEKCPKCQASRNQFRSTVETDSISCGQCQTIFIQDNETGKLVEL